MMMTIWKFLVMIYSEQTTHLILNEAVFVFTRNSLPWKILNIQYLHECINFEIRVGGKLCRFVSLYRSPSQSQDDFESFANSFELNIDTATAHNTFLTVVFGDFNAKANLWFKGDKTTYECSKIDGITSTFGLQQIINEPTHIIGYCPLALI